MKTVLFFDRCDLTRLYLQLTKEIEGKVVVVHVAYSNVEAEMLEAAGITNYISYYKEMSYLVDTLRPSEALLKEIDEMIIRQSQGKFTLNGSIQSDRGYTLLNYDESLLLACCHYTIWKNIFDTYHVDVMYHEPASQFMTHIAALWCKKQGGKFIYLTQLQGDKQGYYYLNIDGEDFSCEELQNKFNYYKEHPEEINRERCVNYVNEFKSNYEIGFSNIVSVTSSKLKLFGKSVKKNLYFNTHRNRYDRLKNNIDYWMLRNNTASNKLHNIHQYKELGIKFVQPIEGEKYFYYSIHLEPEATVLYLSGGLYTNQIKLIENIAASLPAGYYLYVKDHPHEYAYRVANDYERLMKIPNVRLIDQKIPGKLLVKNAVGVFSINGTVGYEGLILGKQVFCFGKSYYTVYPRVHYINNIKDARKIIYRSLNEELVQDSDFWAFIYAYLTSMHKGFVTYFGDRSEKAGVDNAKNAQLMSDDIINFCEGNFLFGNKNVDV